MVRLATRSIVRRGAEVAAEDAPHLGGILVAQKAEFASAYQS